MAEDDDQFESEIDDEEEEGFEPDDDGSRDSPCRALYLVTKQEFSQIVVAADAEYEALEASEWLGVEKEPWHSHVHSSAVEISSLEMLPATFHRKVPVDIYADEVRPEKTCEQILNDELWEDWDIGKYENIIDANAADRMLNGAAILRPPKDSGEIAFYMKMGVYAVRTGVFFTSVSPFPRELRPYFVCYAVRPQGVQDLDA